MGHYKGRENRKRRMKRRLKNERTRGKKPLKKFIRDGRFPYSSDEVIAGV